MGNQSGNWLQWLKNAAKAIGSFIASTVSVVSKQTTFDDVVNDIKNYNFSIQMKLNY